MVHMYSPPFPAAMIPPFATLKFDVELLGFDDVAKETAQVAKQEKEAKQDESKDDPGTGLPAGTYSENEDATKQAAKDEL